MMAAFVLLISIALAHLANAPCQASSHYKAYETISHRVEGNNKLTAEKIYIIVDSDDHAPKATANEGETMTNKPHGHKPSPSTGTFSAPSDATSERIKLRVPVKNGWFHRHNMVGNVDYDADSLNSIMGHQIARLRPRTVESPALSVDTGQARSGSPSVRLANGIKKLFNVEEGHYTDIYDRIDKHKPLVKKKPAEKMDERLGLHPRH